MNFSNNKKGNGTKWGGGRGGRGKQGKPGLENGLGSYLDNQKREEL
jgi:hypothetical protein